MQIRITRPCPLRQLIPILMLEHVLQSGVVLAILGFAMGCGLEKSPNSLWTRGKKQRAAYMSKKKRIITIKCERRLIHICVDFS